MVPLSFPRDHRVFFMALMGNFLLKFGVYGRFQMLKDLHYIYSYLPHWPIFCQMYAQVHSIYSIHLYIYIYVCIYTYIYNIDIHIYIYVYTPFPIYPHYIMPTCPRSCFLVRGNHTVTNPDLETERQQLRCDYPRLVDDCRSSYGVFHRSV